MASYYGCSFYCTSTTKLICLLFCFYIFCRDRLARIESDCEWKSRKLIYILIYRAESVYCRLNNIKKGRSFVWMCRLATMLKFAFNEIGQSSDRDAWIYNLLLIKNIIANAIENLQKRERNLFYNWNNLKRVYSVL